MQRAVLLSILGLLAITGVAFALASLTPPTPEPAAHASHDPVRRLELDAWHAQLAKTPDSVLLDVRMDHEYAEGHIPGAVNLWVETLAKERALDAPKDAPVFVYCKLGIRAARAAGILEEMGYTNVVVLVEGGFPDWAKAGYPIAKGSA